MRLPRGRALGALPWIMCLLACSPANAQRLPTTVVPEHYDLAFDVDLATARFEGVERPGPDVRIYRLNDR